MPLSIPTPDSRNTPGEETSTRALPLSGTIGIGYWFSDVGMTGEQRAVFARSRRGTKRDI